MNLTCLVHIISQHNGKIFFLSFSLSGANRGFGEIPSRDMTTLPDDIDEAYWNAGFAEGCSVCVHHWEICCETTDSKCACASRLFLQSMILPSETHPGETVTEALDTNHMDKKKKSYILGFICAVGQCTQHACELGVFGSFVLPVT